MLALFPVCLEDPVEGASGLRQGGADAPFSADGLDRMVARHGRVVLFGSRVVRPASEPSDDRVETVFRSLVDFLRHTLVRPTWALDENPALEAACAFTDARRAEDPGWERANVVLTNARKLQAFMGECSEERICASWETGNGVTLWRQLHAPGPGVGDGFYAELTGESRAVLRRLLSDGEGFWWEWFGSRLVPIPIEDWRQGRVCMFCGDASAVRCPGENGELYASCGAHLEELSWYVQGGADACFAAARVAWMRATLPRRTLDSFQAVTRALLVGRPRWEDARLGPVGVTAVELDPDDGDDPTGLLVSYGTPAPEGVQPCGTYRLPFVTDADGTPLDPGSAWEILATADVIPHAWLGAWPVRAFVCWGCDGTGVTWAYEKCAYCGDGTGVTWAFEKGADGDPTPIPRGSGLHPAPTSFLDVLLFASARAGVERAEHLAREFFHRVRRLHPRPHEPWHGRGCRDVVPVVWSFGPPRAFAEGWFGLDFASGRNFTDDERAQGVAALLPCGLWIEPGSPLLAPLDPDPRPDETARVPHVLRPLYRRRVQWDASRGPNPWEPLYALWCEGYRLDEVMCHGLRLAVDRFPVARPRGRHG